jgi:hypothetical protein
MHLIIELFQDQLYAVSVQTNKILMQDELLVLMQQQQQQQQHLRLNRDHHLVDLVFESMNQISKQINLYHQHLLVK